MIAIHHDTNTTDRLALFDVNPNCLEFACRRLARVQPSIHLRNVLEPVRCGPGPFSSLALGGVLHCLPGSMREKGRVFDNLQPILARDSVVFGYTLVSDGEAREPLARVVQALLNAAGVINNTTDTSEGLKHELDARFNFATLHRVGAFAFFTAGNGEMASRQITRRR